MNSNFRVLRASLSVTCTLCALLAKAQTPAEVPVTVVTGTRVAADSFSLPMAIGVVGGDVLREQTLGVNISETLARVPGLNAQNRGNYAQDLQISSRGFGARASFGVRGIRLFTDGIPATQPDGQGQVSHFGIGSADRIEVLRGPFSVLYGNASGGVVQIFTEDAPKVPEGQISLTYGPNETQRASLVAASRFEVAGMRNTGLTFEASRFSTEGFRAQSAATKSSGNAKFSTDDAQTQFTLIANALNISALDALGLSRAEFDAKPDQTTPTATQFNTRKDTRQNQIGARVTHAWDAALSAEVILYSGNRSVTQWQAIPIATQTAATQPGGVIDFERSYGGVDAKLFYKNTWGSLVLGANFDMLDEDRRGYENFIGTTLGVTGKLRRDEQNNLRNQDFYGQAEIKIAPQVSLTAGARHSDVRLTSEDRYIVLGKNPDESGKAKFTKTTPVVGLTFRATQGINFYASAGRGFETPTFNELSYRAGGLTGLNFDLKPAVSDSVEVGAKFRVSGVRATLSFFDTRTQDEIVTLTNSGGRSAFQNAGATRRRGAEFALQTNLAPQFDVAISATALDAQYREDFNTCGALPCTAPTVRVAVGNKLPGLPDKAAFAELKWTHPTGLSAALEIKHQGKVWVNDTNTDFARATTTSNLRAGYGFQSGALLIDLGGRIDNLADKRYAGTVIVNEANGRFYEPAPGRTWLIKLGATYRLN